ncbi:hypothetical protein [Methylomagnum sp.]
MKRIWPFLAILLYASNGAAGQTIRVYERGEQIKWSSAFGSGLFGLAKSHKQNIKSTTEAVGIAKSRQVVWNPSLLKLRRTNPGAYFGRLCADNNNSWSVNRSSRYVGNSSQAPGLEEYLRDAKLKEKEKASQPQASVPDSKNKVLLWFAVGTGGLLLAAGVVLWLIFRIKIPPCPKCQNVSKKTLRIGESCRTPSNFWVKCYCDACGYKWIQKGRRA